MSVTELEAPPAAPKKERAPKRTNRDEELSGRKKIRGKLVKVFDDVEKGFKDQTDRADSIMDYWDLYNCNLGRKQMYSGMTNIFVPHIRNGIDALVTRHVNQAFPQSGRHVEVVTGEEDEPYGLLSLMEHYIEAGKMRTQAVRAILTNGQVEGQYNAYVRWDKIERWVVAREAQPMSVGGIELPGVEDVETIIEEKITDELPFLEPLSDADVLIIPATVNSVDEALERGGSVTVIRRWTKTQIEDKAEDGEIDADEGDSLLEAMNSADTSVQNTAKKLAYAAGIHVSDGGGKIAVVYETWTKLKVDGRMRLCRCYGGGENKILGCKLNPYWNDRCPVLSAPVKKLPGVIKGESPIAACEDLQLWANDMGNEAADQMYYTLAPVLAVDPEKVSKWKELVADVAAVWPVQPDGVKMFEWPNKAREAMEIIAYCQSKIFETLGVNPAMLPQQTGKPGSKRNQAEVALEQQVDLLTTADAVTVLEQEILTPTIQRFAEYDHQFREESVTVRKFGELGLEMNSEDIQPIQMGNRWKLRWLGVETARNAAASQMMISLLNVLKAIPPQLIMGHRLDAVAIIQNAVLSVCGTAIARKTFKNLKDELSVDPKVENQMLDMGMEVHTHGQDPDPQHIQAHMQGMQAARDPKAKQAYQVHIAAHQRAMQMKQAAMAMQGSQGKPQGGPTARPGAQVAGPKRGVQAPAGAIHPDAMPRAGAPQMPRKT